MLRFCFLLMNFSRRRTRATSTAKAVVKAVAGAVAFWSEAAKAEGTKEMKAFLTMEMEIQKCMASSKKIAGIWRLANTARASLAALMEVDALVVKKYPLLDYKPGIIRAFEHATIVRAHDEEGREGFFVPKEHFPALLRDILYFTMALKHYEDVPIGEEREITLAEFPQFCNSMGLYLKEHEQEELFRKILSAKEGSSSTSSPSSIGEAALRFDEICVAIAARKCPIDREWIEEKGREGQ